MFVGFSFRLIVNGRCRSSKELEIMTNLGPNGVGRTGFDCDTCTIVSGPVHCNIRHK